MHTLVHKPKSYLNLPDLPRERVRQIFKFLRNTSRTLDLEAAFRLAGVEFSVPMQEYGDTNYTCPFYSLGYHQYKVKKPLRTLPLTCIHLHRVVECCYLTLPAKRRAEAGDFLARLLMLDMLSGEDNEDEQTHIIQLIRANRVSTAVNQRVMEAVDTVRKLTSFKSKGVLMQFNMCGSDIVFVVEGNHRTIFTELKARLGHLHIIVEHFGAISFQADFPTLITETGETKQIRSNGSTPKVMTVPVGAKTLAIAEEIAVYYKKKKLGLLIDDGN